MARPSGNHASVTVRLCSAHLNSYLHLVHLPNVFLIHDMALGLLIPSSVSVINSTPHGHVSKMRKGVTAKDSWTAKVWGPLIWLVSPSAGLHCWGSKWVFLNFATKCNLTKDIVSDMFTSKHDLWASSYDISCQTGASYMLFQKVSLLFKRLSCMENNFFPNA